MAEARHQEKLQREKQEEEEKLEDKVHDMHIEKTDKENANSVISWRQNKSDDRKVSPDRRNDNRRRDNRDNNDYNSFNRNRNDRNYRNDRNDRNDRNERSDLARGKSAKYRKPTTRDDAKPKRDVKVERPLPKYQPNQSKPALQSNNKFLGLDDDDDSE